MINLVIAHGAYRVREFATRESLGASRVDLLRLVLLELGAVVGGAILVGVGLTTFILTGLNQILPAEIGALGRPAMNRRVVAFSGVLGAVCFAAAVGAAWFSRRQVSRGDPDRVLVKQALRLRWTRFVLVLGQAATAMVLLVAGTLLVRSYLNLWSQDPGFVIDVRVVSVSYPSTAPSRRLLEDINQTLKELRAMPNVAAAAAISGSLLDDYTSIGGPTVRIGNRVVRLVPQQVTPGYFEALGVNMLAGRELAGNDYGWRAVVVNAALASSIWPATPLSLVPGQPILLVSDGSGGEIVGVAQDIFDRALDIPPAPTIFRRLEHPSPMMPVHFVVRPSKGIRGAAVDVPARRTIAAVNPDAVILAGSAIGDRLAATVSDRSFATLVLALFAAAGMIVIGSGLFSVVAHTVARRKHEIAIRMAIGAQPGTCAAL